MQIIRRPYDLAQSRFSDQIHPLLQRIYLARGIYSEQMIDRQLSALPSPASMHGLSDAVALLTATLRAKEKIVIVGDFDADGATSSALMVLALGALGFTEVSFLVPNRFDYGYGLTPEIVDLAAQQQPQLIVTVDNGISSLEGVAHANALGIKVIVTDHHLPGKKLPAAAAIVNPNQPACQFPGKNLAGVGVAFYLLSALRAQLREDNWFTEKGIPEPNMATWLDLVALGTVADVVPLDQLNRALVHQGLMRIRSGNCRPGITALLSVAGRNPARLVSSDLAFALGPRLNAAGRLDDISLGIQCLLTEDPQMSLDTARLLDELNQDRKVIEQDMQREAISIVNQLHLEKQGDIPEALCLFQPEWHQGVVGLLASRIKEKFHRPVIAFARAEGGELKGSARSVSALHIRDTLDVVATKNPGLIEKFGGHAMAAGLSLKEQNLAAFTESFRCETAERLSDEDLQASVLTDGVIASDQINREVAWILRESGPWGQHFPEPTFEGTFIVKHQRIVGEKHLKLILATEEQPERNIDAIHFNADTSVWPSPAIGRVHCVFKLDINEYRGLEKVQLLVDLIDSQ